MSRNEGTSEADLLVLENGWNVYLRGRKGEEARVTGKTEMDGKKGH